MTADRTWRGGKPVAMILLPFVIPLAVGCATSSSAATEDDWVGVCSDPRNPDDPYDDVRVDDSRCGDYDDDGDATGSTTMIFLWTSLTDTRVVPPVGGSTAGYSTHRHFPARAGTAVGLPPTGASNVRQAVTDAGGNLKTQRGGFGSGSVKSGGSKAGTSGGSKAGTSGGSKAGTSGSSKSGSKSGTSGGS